MRARLRKIGNFSTATTFCGCLSYPLQEHFVRIHPEDLAEKFETGNLISGILSNFHQISLGFHNNLVAFYPRVNLFVEIGNFRCLIAAN